MSLDDLLAQVAASGLLLSSLGERMSNGKWSCSLYRRGSMPPEPVAHCHDGTTAADAVGRALAKATTIVSEPASPVAVPSPPPF
jgi:hypothetical protein